LTVQEYVQNILLGQNVSVSNITFNGGSANVVSPSVGGFDCPNCNLNIFSGFAMTTGDVAGLVGPNNISSFNGNGTGGAAGQDPDLLDLIQELIPGADPNIVDVNDWVIIEFDFVPLGDTLQFQYVWASEEYDEFVGTNFNDIFGFFISGPGISGPYANNAANIARVPDTNAPVAISTINNGNGNTGPCTSCDYYNQDGQYAAIPFDDPIHSDPYYMQLDGYTDVLTATAIVQCGETQVKKKGRPGPGRPFRYRRRVGLARGARDDGRVGVPVAGEGLFVRTGSDRALLAVADGVDTAGGDAALDQIATDRLGATGTQGQVVLAGAALVDPATRRLWRLYVPAALALLPLVLLITGDHEAREGPFGRRVEESGTAGGGEVGEVGCAHW
jgi:hypothetical protein